MNTFLKKHNYYDRDTTQTTIGDVRNNIPDELRKILGQVSGNSYANGFFRFIAPHTFRRYCAMWKLDPNRCVPFIKCAFGHLIFYHEQEYKMLDPVHNCIDSLGGKDELDFVLDILLCDREGLINSFFIDAYEHAFGRLGAPQSDEVYAFVPALGLGGCRSPANVHKVKMEPQMMILAQI